jgi:predicted transcriptional regulator
MDTEAFTIRSDSKKVKQLDKLASQTEFEPAKPQ